MISFAAISGDGFDRRWCEDGFPVGGRNQGGRAGGEGLQIHGGLFKFRADRMQDIQFVAADIFRRGDQLPFRALERCMAIGRGAGQVRAEQIQAVGVGFENKPRGGAWYFQFFNRQISAGLLMPDLPFQYFGTGDQPLVQGCKFTVKGRCEGPAPSCRGQIRCVPAVVGYYC